jgi:hypothetical protein
MFCDIHDNFIGVFLFIQKFKIMLLRFYRATSNLISLL